MRLLRVLTTTYALLAAAFGKLEWQTDSVFTRTEFQYIQTTFRVSELQDKKKKSLRFFKNAENNSRNTSKSLLLTPQVVKISQNVHPEGKNVFEKIISTPSVHQPRQYPTVWRRQSVNCDYA
jgi:hypothetical protein